MSRQQQLSLTRSAIAKQAIVNDETEMNVDSPQMISYYLYVTMNCILACFFKNSMEIAWNCTTIISQLNGMVKLVNMDPRPPLIIS